MHLCGWGNFGLMLPLIPRRICWWCSQVYDVKTYFGTRYLDVTKILRFFFWIYEMFSHFPLCSCLDDHIYFLNMLTWRTFPSLVLGSYLQISNAWTDVCGSNLLHSFLMCSWIFDYGNVENGTEFMKVLCFLSFQVSWPVGVVDIWILLL